MTIRPVAVRSRRARRRRGGRSRPVQTEVIATIGRDVARCRTWSTRWRWRGCTASRCSRCRTDLYIPPDALEVFLEAFEGPLDLLLYLIRKQNFNILDIPMAGVTRQYLAYVEQIRTPQPRARRRIPADGGDADRDQVAHAAAAEEDGRRRGARRPARRAGAPPARIRADEAGRRARSNAAAADRAATSCARRSTSSSRCSRAFPTSNVVDLRKPGATSSSAPSWCSTTRSRARNCRVREHMSIVLRKLQGRKFVEFEHLFDVARGMPVLIVTFIAMLELAQGNADRGDAGRGLRADLRAARLPAGLSADPRDEPYPWHARLRRPDRRQRPGRAVAPRCTSRPRTAWRSSPSAR